MLTWIKNKLLLLRPKETLKEKTYNSELVTVLLGLSFNPKVSTVLSDPVNSMLLIEVYTHDFNDLLANVVNVDFTREMLTINIRAYMGKHSKDLSYTFKRLAGVLAGGKISRKVECDLLTLTRTIKELLEY